MRARDGETTEALDIRVEVDAGRSTDDDPPDDDAEDDAIIDDFGDAEAEMPPGALEIESLGDVPAVDRRADLVIPDDPTVLSYLLSGIVQIELPRRQALLEAATTVERLASLIRLLDREVLLLGSRLRLFAPDPRLIRGPRRS